MSPFLNEKSAWGARMLRLGPAALSWTEVALGKLSTVLAIRYWTGVLGDELPASYTDPSQK
jgi:hypothetical protein